jgi:hypothetical protein
MDEVLNGMEWSDKDGMWANLELDHNNMSDISLIELIDVLSHHYVAIRRARLFNNFISDRGATRLARAIGQQEYALEEVHLSHNRLTARSLVAICLAVAAKRPAPGCNFPCWARLEHNRIGMPMKVLELLHHDAWVVTCQAKNRSCCGPGRCVRCVGGSDDPRVHLFLLSSQRDEEGVYVDFRELRAEIARWWNLVGQWKRPQAKAYVDELVEIKTEQGEPPRLGRSGMPVLLGRNASKQDPVLRDAKGMDSDKNDHFAPDALKPDTLSVPLPPGFMHWRIWYMKAVLLQTKAVLRKAFLRLVNRAQGSGRATIKFAATCPHRPRQLKFNWTQRKQAKLDLKLNPAVAPLPDTCCYQC